MNPEQQTTCKQKVTSEQGGPWKLGKKWERQPTKIDRLERQISRLMRQLKMLKGASTKRATPQPGSVDIRSMKSKDVVATNRFALLSKLPSPTNQTSKPMSQISVNAKSDAAVKAQRGAGKSGERLNTRKQTRKEKKQAGAIQKTAKQLGGPRPNLSAATLTKPRPLSSIANGTKTKAQHTSKTTCVVDGVNPVPSVPMVQPSIVTDVTESPVLRRMPRAFGPSSLATQEANRGKQPRDPATDDLPVKSCEDMEYMKPAVRPSHGFMGWKKIVGVGEIKSRQQTLINVDQELYGYLVYTFQFQERNVITLRQMASKAKQFLAGFSLQDSTYMQLHKLSTNAIAMAMNVPNEEIKTYDYWANTNATKERERHAALVTTGRAAPKEQNALQRMFLPKKHTGLAPVSKP